MNKPWRTNQSSPDVSPSHEVVARIEGWLPELDAPLSWDQLTTGEAEIYGPAGTRPDPGDDLRVRSRADGPTD